DHVRYLQKAGLVTPRRGGGTQFSFQDVSLLRQIHGELARGVPFRAALRELQASRQGQLSFDFRLDAEPARILALAKREPPVPSVPGAHDARGDGTRPLSRAEQHFLDGSLLDDGTPERQQAAALAYRRALHDEPDLVAALINLANIRYAWDELPEAQALYERAIRLDDSFFEAHFNLGNIHHDLGRHAAAVEHYRHALSMNGEYAEGHFYLAVTLEKLGRSAEARQHWRAYQFLAPDGEWVDLAKEFGDDPPER
ncbi:MAG: tetratricopeptide repeat protein, partial [Vicinamibacterales bacterium]